MSSADRRSLIILLAALAGAGLLGTAVHPGTARSGRGEAGAPALRMYSLASGVLHFGGDEGAAVCAGLV